MLCLDATHSTVVTSLESSCFKAARAACQPVRSKLRCPRQIRSPKRVCAASSTGSSTLQHQLRGQKAAISLDNVGVAFETERKRKQVLNGACLQVQRGTFHILLGPNGCGKSTLLRVLGGLLQSNSGSCEIDGPVGFVFQNPDHQVVMPTVAADVAFGLGRYALSTADALAQAQHALKLVGMEDFVNRPTHSLSGGQKQRVAIAGALAECPKVLLLDELTTFLDSTDQEGVLRAVRDVVGLPGSDPVTALWVTHRLEELQWADTASYMDNGQIQFTGPAKDVAKYMQSLGAH